MLQKGEKILKEQVRDDEIEIDLMELLHVLLKNIWVLIMCMILGAAAAFGSTKLLITPQYEATSMIYILSKSTSISSYLDVQIGQQLTVDFETLATTRTVVETVINELQLDTTYEKLCKDIHVVNPTGTQILKIIVKNPDPVLAKDISNAMSEATANRIAEVMMTDKPNIADCAVTPDKPVSPNIVKNTAIGGLIGLLFSAAIVLIRVLMDDTIVDRDDVAKYLGLTTLAVIPMNQEENTGRRNRGRNRKRRSR